MQKSPNDLREDLSEQIELLKSGKADIKTANAISATTRTYISTWKIQLEALRSSGLKLDLINLGAMNLLPKVKTK